MPAPIGNTNAQKGRLWNQAIMRALARRSKVEQIEGLDALADKLLKLCDEGDLAALKEFGDRIDGKPKQQIDFSDDDGNATLMLVAGADALRDKLR